MAPSQALHLYQGPILGQELYFNWCMLFCFLPNPRSICGNSSTDYDRAVLSLLNIHPCNILVSCPSINHLHISCQPRQLLHWPLLDTLKNTYRRLMKSKEIFTIQFRMRVTLCKRERSRLWSDRWTLTMSYFLELRVC